MTVDLGHRQHLLKLRHRLQDQALKAADPLPLDDQAVEADEMYQNAGEKRRPAYRPTRPTAAPREPAAGARDHGQRPTPGRRGGRPDGQLEKVMQDAMDARAGHVGDSVRVPGGFSPHSARGGGGVLNFFN